MKRNRIWTVLAVGLSVATAASAAPQLVITELYVGVDGADITADWFEVTNFGDTSWDLGTAPLWYDDSSPNATNADPINGLTQIAPAESVVVVIGADTVVAPFVNAWDNSGQLAGVQVGWVAGSDFSQTGDQATLIDSLAPFNILTLQAYLAGDVAPQGSTLIYNPVTQTFGAHAQAGVWGAYLAPGGPAGNSGEFPLIGSPGVVVPEPAALTLLALGGLTLARRRRPQRS